MTAEEALQDYRKTSDPAILEMAAGFNKLSPRDKVELLYFMICNTNMLVTAGATVTPVAAPRPDETAK